MMMYGSYQESILKAIKEVDGICYRCQLRLAGIKNSKLYKQDIPGAATTTPPKETSEEDGSPPPATKMLKKNPCRGCIGILEDEIMGRSLDKIREEIKESGYDADHFTIAISLPPSLTLRNQSLSIYLQEKLEEDFEHDDIVPIKQVWKWLYPNKLVHKLDKKYVTGESCEFFAELIVQFSDDEEEIKSISLMCEKEYAMREAKSRKYHMGLVTRQGIEKSLQNVTSKTFKKHYSVPPNIPNSNFTTSLKMYHNNIFIAGRYNKYSRELPQTPWIVDGERKMETSVEEIILKPIESFFKFDSAKFSSSGREDVDVRMLGKGRPFLFEIVNPRKTYFLREEFKLLSSLINSSSTYVQIRDLQIVSKSQIKSLKEGEDQKMKTYRAVCNSPSDCDIEKVIASLNVKELTIQQKTPIRVLHRRPNAIRTRGVINMRAKKCEKHKNKFILELTTQAGTYVKEFVHGDFQRTVPNCRIISGANVDIEALDVEKIDLDWPPSIE